VDGTREEEGKEPDERRYEAMEEIKNPGTTYN